MPLDRDAALQTADKLLRQGKLADAIAEYVRLVEQQPSDWNSINALGDLYVRAGDGERAAARFAIVADHLYEEGFFPRAAALYKKALKVHTDHDHSLGRLLDIAERQGMMVDVRHYVRELVKRRDQQGDLEGAAGYLERLAKLSGGGAVRRESRLPADARESEAEKAEVGEEASASVQSDTQASADAGSTAPVPVEDDLTVAAALDAEPMAPRSMPIERPEHDNSGSLEGVFDQMRARAARGQQDRWAPIYELADALERRGDHSQAIAIFLEVQSGAGDYRDVAQRIERLRGEQGSPRA